MQVFWLAALLAAAPPASAGLGLVSPSGSSAAPPEEEVLEFPDFVYSQKVIAPNPKTGCVEAPSRPEWLFLPDLPCEPDSFEDMCRFQYKKQKDSGAKRAAQLKPYFDQLKVAVRQIMATVERLYGKPPPKDDPHRFEWSKKALATFDQDLPPAIKAVDDKIRADLAPSAGKVAATVERVRATLRRALANAPKLAPNDYLLKKILNCKMTLELNTRELDDNATMASRIFDISYSKLRDTTENGEDVKLVTRRSAASRGFRDGFEVLVNPLEEADFQCHLSLMPATWLACEEGTPSCIRTLFHELGHTLNSCNFYWANAKAKGAYEEYKDASVDSLKHVGVYAKFLAGQTLDMARTMVRATECLSAISDPKDAVPNSCPRPPIVDEEFYQRCGINGAPGSPLAALPGYPAQWDEAEADFWASSGVARWLEENYPSALERRRAFYAIWAEDCATEEALNEERTKDAPKITVTGPSSSPSKALPACKRTPLSKPHSKPWGGSHQAEAWRSNRNFMRNSDLRKALGCPARDARIPLTCSPLR